MMVVWLELWPGGDGTKAQPLGAAEISNDGTGTKILGHYNVTLYKFGTNSEGKMTERDVWRRGRVVGFPRQGLGPWHLLMRALVAILGARR